MSCQLQQQQGCYPIVVMCTDIVVLRFAHLHFVLQDFGHGSDTLSVPIHCDRIYIFGKQVETLQKEFKIVVTGPTTLGAILNSLQMGFRTLAIQKRTSEVWNVLGAVKTEFGKFGGLLEKVQKNLQNAGDQLEEVMGKRTRAIERKLRQVEALPTEESQKMLNLPDLMEDEDD